MSKPKIASLDECIAKLQDELRVTRAQVRILQRERLWATFAPMFAFGIPVVALFLVAFVSPVPAVPPNTVHAPFVVLGASGTKLMTVREDGPGGHLDIYNASQEVVASLRADASGGTLDVYSSGLVGGSGREAVEMGIGRQEGIGYLAIADQDGYDRAELGADVSDKSMALSIYNDARERVAWFGEETDGSGAFFLAQAHGGDRPWRVKGGVGGPHGVSAGIGVVRATGPTERSAPVTCGQITGWSY